jgi:hypothetical protein
VGGREEVLASALHELTAMLKAHLSELTRVSVFTNIPLESTFFID